MYFHPWALLFGIIFAGLSVLAWMSPFVMDDPLAGGLHQFLARFIFPLFAAIAIWGALTLPADVLPNDAWLHVAFIVLLTIELCYFVWLLWQRLQRKKLRSDNLSVANHSES